MEEENFKRNSVEEYLDLLAELVDGIDEECKSIIEENNDVSDEEMIEYIKNIKEATERFKSDFNRDKYLGK